MTDRIHSYTVVLEKDIREDDAEPIINAIKIIKGVLTATPHVADINSTVAKARVRTECLRNIIDICN